VAVVVAVAEAAVPVVAEAAVPVVAAVLAPAAVTNTPTILSKIIFGWHILNQSGRASLFTTGNANV
jgi:hypothetical protein